MAPPPSQGTTRPREDESAAGAGEPAGKRAKVEKLAFGQLYNEIDWMSLHPDPITLSVQLPANSEKPEWKLDGSIVDVEQVPVITLFSTVRERIKRTLDADLPISRMRIEYNGKVMNNQSSLASVNIGEGDMVVLTLKKK
jgi:splicing factor 3A subunit 1